MRTYGDPNAEYLKADGGFTHNGSEARYWIRARGFNSKEAAMQYRSSHMTAEERYHAPPPNYAIVNGKWFILEKIDY